VINPEKAAVEIIIVGGGATGVELAAELHHAIEQAARFGLNIAAGKISFTLIESAPRLLSTLAQQVSQRIVEKLTQMNIQVLLNERVIEVSQQGVTTHAHKFIAGNMIIWTAGIKAPDSLTEMSDLERNKINQLLVTPTLQTTLDPAIFALGDCACCPQVNGKPVPPRAQAAHQQAAFLVRALTAYLRNKPLPYYRYHDYGSIITLSHYKTVGTVMSRTSKSLLLEGKIARLAYLALYKSHQIKLFGWWQTFLFSIQRLFSKHYPRLKLH
jgi:NADH dehydrogenase